MKISISLAVEDVEFLDHYAHARGGSRSGAVHEAIDTLRREGLRDDYEEAFQEWDRTGEDQLWDLTASDGL